MGKRLEDMTLAELWELFPIVLAPHDGEWQVWAEEEIGTLREVLAGLSPQISHIGSTAIPGIMAKPIIDILVEVSGKHDWRRIRQLLTDRGYICMSQSDNRMSFNKGYTADGYARRVFHVHIHLPGDNDEILFRDYLIANPDIAKEYERLKTGLLPEFRNDRDGYTDAKSQFIKRIISEATKLPTGERGAS